MRDRSFGNFLVPLRNAARGLCVFLLLFGTFLPTSADDPKPVTAIFLIARAGLPDPNFKDSVVLVMNNIGVGPAGLIINRPTKFAVSRLFPDRLQLAQVPDKVYFGGPVEIGSVWFLFRSVAPRERAVQALDGVYVSANRELLLELLGRDKPMEGLRIYIGHTGWAPGQLEAEVARADWTLEPAAAQEIFNGKSEHPWPAEHAPGVAHDT
jgi:putative transcriptional regulator